MLMIPRYVARSNVTYPAPNKVMSIVVSLVENNQRKNRKKAARAMIGKRIFFMAIRISVRFQIYAQIACKSIFSANIMGGKIQIKAKKNYIFFSIFL